MAVWGVRTNLPAGRRGSRSTRLRRARRSSDPAALAGQDAAYMLKALLSYKDGSRDDDVMSPRAAKLSEDEMKSLAAYYSGLTPKAPNVAQPLTTAQWVEKCDHCHEHNEGDKFLQCRKRYDRLAGALRFLNCTHRHCITIAFNLLTRRGVSRAS